MPPTQNVLCGGWRTWNKWIFTSCPICCCLYFIYYLWGDEKVLDFSYWNLFPFGKGYCDSILAWWTFVTPRIMSFRWSFSFVWSGLFRIMSWMKWNGHVSILITIIWSNATAGKDWICDKGLRILHLLQLRRRRLYRGQRVVENKPCELADQSRFLLLSSVLPSSHHSIPRTERGRKVHKTRNNKHANYSHLLISSIWPYRHTVQSVKEPLGEFLEQQKKVNNPIKCRTRSKNRTPLQ